MSGQSIALSAIFTITLLAVNLSTQERFAPLDNYINNAEMIVVAKCTHIGPVNILLRAKVRLQILHLVKGKADVEELIADSQYGMAVDQRYLVRIAKMLPDGTGGRVDERISVIPLSAGESIDELKVLSPRIVVLRTMNLRIYQLESDIRVKTHELEALTAIKKGN
ncbi:MAG: hypothetical protein KBF83_06420 [Pyrinomonadaceae bacterium]|nr:hypothetical protein [Pyrinomonadaceae bacterium]